MIRRDDEKHGLAPGMPRKGDAALPTARADEASDALGQHDPQSADQESDGTAGSAREPTNRLNPAGPHATPGLTNPDATPGTGTLTPPGAGGDADSTSG